MQKFFVETNQIDNDKIRIVGSDVKHISNVLRMKSGQEILIGDKQSLEKYLVRIEEIKKEEVITTIIEKINESVESNIEIDLYQGLPKADKMELIIQKTTEIGINSIIPVDMVRCIVKLDDKEAKKKIERWQNVALSAAKQSKRDKIPQIEDKIKLKQIVEKIKEYDSFFIAYEEESSRMLKQALKELENKEKYKIGILVGPEGGIDLEEVEILKKNGAKVISLGKRILRTETAPIVMVSNILYELEN